MIRPEDVQRLVINGQEQAKVKGTRSERDFEPAVRLHIEGTDMQWLLTELEDTEIAFGLCQIFVAELGSVWLPELADMDVQGLRVVQDLAFKPTTTLRGYAQQARANGGLLIV
ncbi:DUF2958 domain-containing protein [Sphingobium sp. CR2-8]|uniref:DUF2958 domain-containing protein n=1 Tax=Sphingobium sp. CR2-8 TaxID=1306534 RepID=UPI002DC04842|nr:DUF2958 domain-containing protein [Sphingobium sp. CR2-8]MEC3910086.1 DUF2958 domain-containing protein [Sphingobium sp. CR2-8]